MRQVKGMFLKELSVMGAPMLKDYKDRVKVAKINLGRRLGSIKVLMFLRADDRVNCYILSPDASGDQSIYRTNKIFKTSKDALNYVKDYIARPQ